MTAKTDKSPGFDELMAEVEAAGSLDAPAFVRPADEVLPSDRIALARTVMHIKELLFHGDNRHMVFRYGRKNIEKMVDFLRRAQKQIKENGWQYHVPMPYQEDFHRSFKRHRCIFGGNRCLAKGTLVRMWDSSTKAIEDIEIGDAVRGTDPFGDTCRATVQLKWRSVFDETTRFILEDMSEIVCSPNHNFPVFVFNARRDDRLFKVKNADFIRSALVTPGTNVFLLRGGGSLVRIMSFDDLDGATEMFDITVDSPGSLYELGNGIVTHNSGKTHGGVYELTCFLMGFHPYKPKLFIPPDARLMVAGKTMKTIREAINPKLFSMLPQRKISEIKYLRNDVIDYLVMEGGRRLVFCSYDQRRERFQGPSYFAVHLDEEPPEDIYQEVLMRLIDTKGWLWMTLTALTGLSWVYYTLYQNPDADSEHEDYYWYTEDNSTLDQDEVARVMDKLPEDVRRARARGEFIGASGLIYPWLHTDEAYTQPFDIPAHWQLIRVIDPSAAGTTAVLWVAIDPYSNLWPYREYYERGRSVSEHCHHIQQLSGQEAYVLDLIDGQSLAASGGANLETVYHQYLTHLNAGSYSTSPLIPFTDKKIEDGIFSVWEYMRAAESYVAGVEPEHPFLRPFSNLPNFRNEARKYRWQILQSGPAKGVSTNKPIGKDDHLMDCLRYACHYRLRYAYAGPSTKPKHGYRYKDPVTNY